MNKRGDERVLYFYWFFLFVIVAVAIVIGVGVFYGHSIDVRGAESELLADRIIDCFIDGGKVKDFVSEERIEGNIINLCNLNFRDENYEPENIQYYVNVSFYYLENYPDNFLEIIEGNDFYFPRCDYEGDDRNSPRCIKKNVYSNLNGTEVLMQVVAGIGKVNENA